MKIGKAVTATLVAGRPTSLWALGGMPGAGAYDTTLNGVVLSSSSAQVAGQIRHTDHATLASYLARFSARATQPGTVILADRLWHNGGFNITLTSAQSITSPTWPARCPTSGGDDTPSTNGEGVLFAVEVSGVTGAGVPTITIGYTNSAGTAGRTATNILATVAASAAGATYLIGLQSGDTGARSPQSLTLSATWTSGTINLVAYRFLAEVEVTGTFNSGVIDAVTGGLPRLYNGVVPYLMFDPTTTTASNITGSYLETQT
jgi:hypothetical protein